MNHPAPQARREPFPTERRRALIDQYFATQHSEHEISQLSERATGLDAARLAQHHQFYVRRSLDLREEYTIGVPVLPLSRCPFTNEVVQHSIDYLGLDGLWWDYDAAARPPEQLPATFFALTGALRLADTIPWFPFLCIPGPEVPYVLPRLLEHPAIVAVLSSVAIGAHQGYAITYFANPVPYDIPRVNTWATNTYTFPNEDGELAWDAQPDNPDEFGFDLEPWISSRQLLWIAPGDQTLALRDTVSGCPYLRLPGRRSITCIQEGDVWWD